MNRKLSICTGAAVLTLAFSANAAENPIPNSDRPAMRMHDKPGANHLEQMGKVAKASDIVGMEVKNFQDEKLGKVENLIVDLQTGRVVQVIVSSGGFLGMGDELSSVPPAAFHYDAGQKVLHLDTTKEALTKAPHFKSSEWPNVGDPAYAGEVYHAYNVAPYFRTKPADADNSKRNATDREGEKLTPFNQGSSKADVDLTRQIRKEIRNQKGLSVNAQNVKVITADGNVTLRGPVNNDEEKRTLGEIAERIAQNTHVDNQIEVKRDGKE
jgi:hypothetical protein